MFNTYSGVRKTSNWYFDETFHFAYTYYNSASIHKTKDDLLKKATK